jgi:nucleoside-diphosphate-sugar epimerase
MLVPKLADRVLRGEPVVIEGDPGVRINPLHIGDAVRVFEPALTLGRSGLFNIAGDEILTLTDLVELIGTVTGRHPDIRHTDSTANGDLVGANQQMKQVLGVVPRIRLADGLASVVEAMQVAAS